jgi:hypothetical protein
VFTNIERGTLIIQKETVPDVVQPVEGSTQFEFYIAPEPQGGPGSELLLADDQRHVFHNVRPGSYNLTEADPNPHEDVLWDTTIDCTGHERVEGRAIEDIVVAPGQTVLCIVNNTMRATLHIIKLAAQSQSDESWTFETTGPDYEASHSLGVDSLPYIQRLLPGAYRVNETQIEESSWSLFLVLCRGGPFGAPPTPYVPGDPMVLAPGDDVTCWFYNQLPLEGSALLEVVKTYASREGDPSPPQAVLMVDNATVGNDVAVQVAHGYHWIHEVAMHGYQPSFGEDCDAQGIVFIPSDEREWQCHVLNTRITPTVLVIKHVINDNGGHLQASDFSLQMHSAHAENHTFSGSEEGFLLTMSPGAYFVTETLRDGYLASFAAACSGILALGDHVTCIVTNGDPGPVPVSTGGGGGGGGCGTGCPQPNQGGNVLSTGSGDSDADGDGFLNVIELAAGSDPFDPNSVPNYDLSHDLTVIWEGGNAVLEWHAPHEPLGGYLIWRSNSPFALLVKVPDGQTTFKDPNAPANSKYKITYYTDQTVGGGYVTDPALVSGWKEADHSAPRAPAEAGILPPLSAGGPSWIGIVMLVAAGAVLVASSVSWYAWGRNRSKPPTIAPYMGVGEQMHAVGLDALPIDPSEGLAPTADPGGPPRASDNDLGL